ncbi:OmpA family protein [Pseudoalteromonas sp. 2CM37A]|uniref:OmpA family protein n=1 Tax=Pseudoalteromonas sp. 2CM37A TaxID=2929853 RepID=UPI0020BF70F1|nr:OmpA family protein [Pseudoalteromonas sp. 2CM37A]
MALNVDADTIGKQIQSTGSISLYGIEFDFGSHTLKHSSSEQLAQISAFLTQASNVSLYVVGLTDNKGAYSYNQDLSARRAAEVVKQLVNKYQIDSSRLHPVG